MKLNRTSQNHRPRERGFFLVIVMLMLASIMMLYVAANSRRLTNLKQEIRLIEQKQVQRLNRSANVTTNNIAAPAVAATSAP
jgi:Tfp pilus assembly protein PilX